MKNKYYNMLVIVAAILIIALVTATSYAYFTATVKGNNEADSTVITTGNMSLTFVDDSIVGLYNMYPTQSVEKEFYIENTGEVETNYDVYFSNIINDFADKSDLVYIVESLSGDDLTAGCEILSQRVVPSISNEESKIISSCPIEVGQKHGYKLTIFFVDDNSNQDDNKGKHFSAKLSVNEVYQQTEQIAYLQPGPLFNESIKILSNASTSNRNEGDIEGFESINLYINDRKLGYNYVVDDSIKYITISTSAPQVSDNAIKVNDVTSYYDIYAWYNNNTIYLYTEADEIYLNLDSTFTFFNLNGMEYLDLSIFNTSKVYTMDFMLSEMANLKNINFGNNFNTSNVRYMIGLFDNDVSLTSIDVSSFDTSMVLDMMSVFNHISSLTSLDISNLNTSNVKNMDYLFYNLNLETLVLGSNFDTSKVTSMNHMFGNCINLKSLDVSSFNTSNVTEMYGMFSGCKKLKTLDLSSFNTSKVTNMKQMFKEMTVLESLNLGNNFDTSNVTNMHQMFASLRKLRILNLGSKFNVSKVQNGYDMFQNPSGVLTTIYSTSDLVYAPGANINNMFWNTKPLVGGKGTTYSSPHDNGDYAVIDCGTKRPGYLTFNGTEEEYEQFCSQFD